MRTVSVALAVARKDLTSEWRTRELVPALAQFIVLALVIANFGFQFDSRTAPAIAPGDSFEARFTPPRAGTFIYHTHIDDIRQPSSGLYGAIIVLEPGQ